MGILKAKIAGQSSSLSYSPGQTIIYYSTTRHSTMSGRKSNAYTWKPRTKSRQVNLGYFKPTVIKHRPHAKFSSSMLLDKESDDLTVVVGFLGARLC